MKRKNPQGRQVEWQFIRIDRINQHVIFQSTKFDSVSSFRHKIKLDNENSAINKKENKNLYSEKLYFHTK